jgi:DNA-directed RNA polymerase specialized sigma24 family protein
MILLREFEGMKYDEIASVTGLSLSAVKVRLFKARKLLLVLLAPHVKENRHEGL